MPYIEKCGKSLNALYSKIVHMACAAHGLHKTSEGVRGQFVTIDKIILNIRIFFQKCAIAYIQDTYPKYPLTTRAYHDLLGHMAKC